MFTLNRISTGDALAVQGTGTLELPGLLLLTLFK